PDPAAAGASPLPAKGQGHGHQLITADRHVAVLRRPLRIPPIPASSPTAPTMMPMMAIVFALSTALCFTELVATVVGVVARSPDPVVSVKTGTGLSGSGPPGGETF